MVDSVLPGVVGEFCSEDMEEMGLNMTLESWMSVWQASKKLGTIAAGESSGSLSLGAKRSSVFEV